MSHLISKKKTKSLLKNQLNGAKSYCYLIFISLSLLITVNIPSVQGEIYFNPRFLSDDPSALVDLSVFEKGQEAPAGTYRVDIYLNDGFMATRDIQFVANEKDNSLTPCINRRQLSDMGVNTLSIPNISLLDVNPCIPLSTLIPKATVRFDVALLHLYITIPQLYMVSRGRGYIPPELWDEGINAGILNYSLSGSNARSKSNVTSNYTYLNLHSGLNFGPWRLRDNTIWNYNSGTVHENRWEHVDTYAERNIVTLRSRLTLGDRYTHGDIFNSVNFRGIQIASDDNMLPDSQKGFSPIIRGVARTTASISIKQNGYEIYKNTIPPGPFEINDLYANGSSGNLQVTVKEEDGTTQVFNVPYASVPLLQREGHTRYTLTAGSYRSGNYQQEHPIFLQGVLMRGLEYGVTMYSGTQLAARYKSINIGAGKDMGDLGAISLDLTQANSQLPDDKEYKGKLLRFLYNKSLTDLGTNIQLVGHWYPTKGFFTLADTTYKQMSGYSIVTQDGVIQVMPKLTDYYNLHHNKRSLVQLSVNQKLEKQSNLYINANNQTYWDTNKTDRQLQVGLNTVINDINFGITYSLTKNSWLDNNDQMLALNVNIPFSHWMRSDSHSIWQHASASYNVSHDLRGKVTNTAGLYGTLLKDNNLSYSIQTGYAAGSKNKYSNTGYAALNYRGTYGNANVGYSHTEGYNQIYYGLTGGVLAHTNGLTLSQPMNDTVVLVKAPGASNVNIQNQTGVKTDWRGYAVLPYASDYRENRIALDTNTLADNVDLDETVVRVVPTYGAVVRANFEPRIGVKVLMTLLFKGKPLPFGAVVTSENNNIGSIVADDGQVYLTGLPLSGQLFAKWGNDPDAQCLVDYKLPEESQNKILSEYRAACH